MTAASRTTRLLYVLIVEDEGLEATADEGNEPSSFGYFSVHGEFTEGVLSDVPDEQNAPVISGTFLSYSSTFFFVGPSVLERCPGAPVSEIDILASSTGYFIINPSLAQRRHPARDRCDDCWEARVRVQMCVSFSVVLGLVLWSLRHRERHRFSTRPIVLPFIYDCYLQQRFIRSCVVSDGNLSCTSASCAPTSSELRHYGEFDGTHCSANVSCGGFSGSTGRCRWFEEDMGSDVVFLFDVAHVHHHSLLPIPPLQEVDNDRLGQLRGLGRHESRQRSTSPPQRAWTA